MFRKVWEFVQMVARVVWTVMAIIGLVVTVRFFWNNRIEVVQRDNPITVNTVNQALSSVSPSGCSDIRTTEVEKGDGWLAVIERGCGVSAEQAIKLQSLNTGRLYPGTVQVCCSPE